MRIGLLVVAVLALAGFLAVAVVIPQMAGTEAKEAAAVLIAGAEPARQQVAAAAQKTGNLAGAGNEIKLPSKMDPKFGEMKWIVEPYGSVRAWNEKNTIEIAITPGLQGGKLSWTCRGYPIIAMPTTCGGRS